MKVWLKIGLILGFITSQVSCIKEEAETELPTIIATTGMVADLVTAVVGEHATVQGLIGSGIDPHLYKPTRHDVVALNEADIIFYNGLMLEGKMTQILESVAAKGKPVYAIADALKKDGEYVINNEDGHLDPHVWMDVYGWKQALKVVEKALIAFDPSKEAIFQENAANYREQLLKLDTYAYESIATIPMEKRVLITAHDAFGYMGRAYGLDVRGIQGLSTESEAGIRDIENLISFIVENNIPAVFAETSVSDKNVHALIEGAKAKGHELNLGGNLFSDAMGNPQTYEGTYLGMIDHNVTTIVRSLGGEAPEKGLFGKLNER